MDITIRQLLALDNPNIIDIRSNYQYSLGHLPNAKNIPSLELIQNFSKYLDKDKVYYIYCQSGVTSSKLCKSLSNNGYKVVNVLGGYMAYKSK